MRVRVYLATEKRFHYRCQSSVTVTLFDCTFCSSTNGATNGSFTHFLSNTGTFHYAFLLCTASMCSAWNGALYRDIFDACSHVEEGEVQTQGSIGIRE